MSLMDRIRADVQQILTNPHEFAAPVLFTAPDASMATVHCRTMKHHLGINDVGAAVNSKTASITVSEPALVAVGYTVRNGHNEVSLKGHRVTWTDSTGQASTYMIREWFPDESLGVIVCILGDYQ